MSCVQGVVAKLQAFASVENTRSESIVDECVKSAITHLPHKKFTKAFSSERARVSKLSNANETNSGQGSISRPVVEEVTDSDYEGDADQRLREMYEKSKPGEEHTLDQIAKVMGVTRERVRQIEAAAMRKFYRRFSLMMKQDNIPLDELKR
jgi:DNA-directed RNA polymerase specialized sigma subunit